MATVINIEKGDSRKLVKEKIQSIQMPLKKKFKARKFTGKIKSFGDALEFQKSIRDEWE